MKIKLFTVPNIITLCNLLCGCGSIVASLMFCDFRLALILIVASAVCDFFDGFSARLLGQYSEIGVQARLACRYGVVWRSTFGDDVCLCLTDLYNVHYAGCCG